MSARNEIATTNTGLNITCKHCHIEIVSYGVGWVSAEWTEAPRICRGLGREHEPVAQKMMQANKSRFGTLHEAAHEWTLACYAPPKCKAADGDKCECPQPMLSNGSTICDFCGKWNEEAERKQEREGPQE